MKFNKANSINLSDKSNANGPELEDWDLYLRRLYLERDNYEKESEPKN